MKKIKAYVESNYSGHMSRIPLIKTIRVATGLSLVESKEFVDAHLTRRDRIVPMLLTEAQFGRLVACLMTERPDPFSMAQHAYIRRVEMIDMPEHDFSHLG
jgi:hypothetical protein